MTDGSSPPSGAHRPPRIAVYGVGRYGGGFVRLAHRKGWPVVAAYNRAGDKVGRDLGEVARLGTELGVVVQDCDAADFDELRRDLDVDIAIVATSDRLPHNIEGYERLLGAGVNVLSHGTESYFPSLRPEYAERIQRLAEANGVTFTGSGIWDVSRIWSGILAAGPCAEITSLHHTSRTDIGRASIAPIVGIGVSHEEFQQRMIDEPGPVGELYKIIPWQVLTALGYDVDSVTERREPVLFEHPVFSAGLQRDIPAGEPAGTRISVDVTSTQGVTAHATIELRVCLEHETEDFMAWRVQGDPDSGVHVDRQIGHMGSAVALIDGYNGSARFTPDGAAMKRGFIVRVLRNRLRLLRDLDAHPEILDIELHPPIIVHAMPRTGSTKLQKVLSATGDVNWLPYWMTMNYASVTGAHGEDVTERVADVAAYASWFDRRSPETRFGHHMVATEAEEEAYVMMGSLRTPTFGGFARCDSYLAWLATQDPAAQFRYVRDVLKYLVWQGLADPDKPFLLKCVVTLGYEPQLREVYPDATIVALHRTPLEFVPSAAKLGECFRAAYSDHGRVTGPELPRRYAKKVDQSLDHRAAHPEDVFCEVGYRDVRDDVRGVVERIFDTAGVETSERTLANVAAWEDAHPQRRSGGWDYAPEDFGFTAADVRAAFARYIDWACAAGVGDW